MIDVAEIIGAARSLRPLPHTAVKLAELIGTDPGNIALADVTRIALEDPSLVARLLEAANSSAAAGRVRTTTVQEAVMRLGFGAVLRLALSDSLSETMSGPLPAYGLSESELWRLSVAASLATERVVERSTVSVPSAASTVALLHAVSKLVLPRFWNAEDEAAVLRLRRVKGFSQIEAERAVLGVDSSLASALIAMEWGLPPEIANAIQFVSEPDEHCLPLVDAAHSGIVVSRMLGADAGREELAFRCSPRAAERLGLTMESVCEILAQASADLEAIA